MTDPIPTAARNTADRLAADYEPGLAADVEAALHARRTASRPGQYLDPVSLGSLIVSIAALAWTVYTDKRKKTSAPSAEVVARAVRIELGDRPDLEPSDQDKIINAVVIEVIRAAGDSK